MSCLNNLNSVLTSLKCCRPYGTNSKYLEPFGIYKTIWKHPQHLDTGGTIQDQLKQFGTILDKDNLLTIKDHLESFVIMLDYFRPIGIILYHLGLLGTIWDYLGLFGTIWDYLGPFGIIWNYLGPFGTI